MTMSHPPFPSSSFFLFFFILLFYATDTAIEPHICEKFYSNICFTSFGQTLRYHEFQFYKQRLPHPPCIRHTLFAAHVFSQSSCPLRAQVFPWMTTTLLRSALMNNTTHPVWILIDLIPYNPSTCIYTYFPNINDFLSSQNPSWDWLVAFRLGI